MAYTEDDRHSLQRIIGLCNKRCEEINDDINNIDYHIYTIIRKDATTVLENVSNGEKTNYHNVEDVQIETTKEDQTKMAYEAVIENMPYEEWKDAYPERFFDLKDKVRYCGVSSLPTDTYKEEEKKYLPQILDVIKQEEEDDAFDAYKAEYYEEYKKLIKDWYSSQFSINDFSDESLKWFDRIQMEMKKRYGK